MTRTSVSRSGIGRPLLVARFTSGDPSVAPTTERVPARSDRLRCTKCASPARRTQTSRTATHGTGGGVEVRAHDPGQVLLVREAGPDGDLGDGRGIGAQYPARLIDAQAQQEPVRREAVPRLDLP